MGLWAILSIELCSIVAEWLCIVSLANPKNPGPKKGTPGDVLEMPLVIVILVGILACMIIGIYLVGFLVLLEVFGVGRANGNIPGQDIGASSFFIVQGIMLL